MRKQAGPEPPATIGVVQLAKIYYHCLRGCLNRQVPHSGLQFDLEFAFLRVEDIKDALSESIGTKITGDTLLTWLRFFALGCSHELQSEEKRLVDTFKLLVELVQSRRVPGFRFWPDTEFLILREDHEGPIVPDLFAKSPVRAGNIESISKEELKILKGTALDRPFATRHRATRSATPEHSKVSLNLPSDEKSHLDSALFRTQTKTAGLSQQKSKLDSSQKKPFLDVGFLRPRVMSSKKDKMLMSYDTAGAITSSEQKPHQSPLTKGDYSYLVSKAPGEHLETDQLSSRNTTKSNYFFRPSERQDSALNKAVRKLNVGYLPARSRSKAGTPNEDIKTHLQVRRREQINRQLDSLREQHAKNQRKYKVISNYDSMSLNKSRQNLSQVILSKPATAEIKPTTNSSKILPDCYTSAQTATATTTALLHPKIQDLKVPEKFRNFFSPSPYTT